MELHGLATFERSRVDLAIYEVDSNRPYLEMVMSKFDKNGTDRKLRVRAFDRYHFHQIWTSSSRDMGDSSLVTEICILKSPIHVSPLNCYRFTLIL